MYIHCMPYQYFGGGGVFFYFLERKCIIQFFFNSKLQEKAKAKTLKLWTITYAVSYFLEVENKISLGENVT